MKNRNFVIIAIVLVSVICLGVIGYAGYTDDLSVKGNVSISNSAANEDFDNDVHFDTAAASMKASVTAKDITGENETTTTVSKTVAADTDGVTVTVGPQENGDENDLLNIKVDAGILNFEGDYVVVIAKIVNESDEFSASITASANTVTGDAGFTTDTIQFCKTETGTYENSIALAKGESAFVKVVITLDHTVTGDETYTVGDFTFALSAQYITPTT